MNVAKLLGRAEQKNTKRASETRFEPVMKNQRHAREVLYAMMMMMMMMMIVFGFSNPAWSDDAQPNSTSS